MARDNRQLSLVDKSRGRSSLRAKEHAGGGMTIRISGAVGKPIEYRTVGEVKEKRKSKPTFVLSLTLSRGRSMKIDVWCV